MPQVSTKKILIKAKKNKKAVGAFNVSNLEMIRAVIEAAEETTNDVIIQISSRAMQWAKFDYIVPALISAAKNSKTNIAVHLDHAIDFTLIKKAINWGFSSIMFDGSHLDFERNIRDTKKVIKLAHEKGVEVEAEIGKIGGKKGNLKISIINRLNLDDIVKFYRKTKPDFLAIAFGTLHGVYNKEVNLDFELLENVSNKINVPLVMHGSSGVSFEDITRAIKCGIVKINIGTDLLIANFQEIRKYLLKYKKAYNIREIHEEGIKAIKEVVKEYFKLFNKNNT